MGQVVLNKRNDSGNAPAASKLQAGEIAVGYKKGSEKLYIKNSSGEVKSFISEDAVNSKLASKSDTGHEHNKLLPASLPANLNDFNNGSSLQWARFSGKEIPGIVNKDGMIISIPWSNTSYGYQIAVDDQSVNMSVRAKSGSSWTGWKQLAFQDDSRFIDKRVNPNSLKIQRNGIDVATYDGSSEITANITIPDKLEADGGNADTVDNEHASAFVHVAGDTISGNIVPNADNTLNLGSSSAMFSTVHTRYLDTSSGYYLRFKAAGNEYMTLTTSGNLGIGVTEPSQKLDVNGNIRIAIKNDEYGLLPSANNYNQIGSSSQHFYRGWINQMNATAVTTTNLTASGNATATGFIKSGSSDDYVLNGGGGHTLIGTGNSIYRTKTKIHMPGSGDLTSTKGKYVKFARIDLSASAWNAFEGVIRVVDFEAGIRAGNCKVFIRTLSAVNEEACQMSWESITVPDLEKSLVMKKEGPGLFDLYLLYNMAWFSPVILIEAVDLDKITIYPNNRSFVSITPTYISGYRYALNKGFKKNGSDDTYVLTGGGGHAKISGMSVNYASSAGDADTLDGYDSSSFIKNGENIGTAYVRTIPINGNYRDFLSTVNSDITGIYAPQSAGNKGQILRSTKGVPEWVDPTALNLSTYSTKRDFVNGMLIKTSIDYSATSGDPFYMEIKGNTYGNRNSSFLQVQGYIYDDTIISYGMTNLGYHRFDKLVAMNLGGKLCFWTPRRVYWEGFSVFCSSAYSYQRNTVTSVEDVSEPNGTKKVNIHTNTKNSAFTDDIPSIPSISLTTSGSGNAVTSIVESGHKLTVKKEKSFIEDGESIGTAYIRGLQINDVYWNVMSNTNNDITPIFAPNSKGTNGQILKSTGSIPEWANPSWLSLSGGKMTGPIKFNGNSSLPQKSLSYVCGIDAFSNGGEMGWESGDTFVSRNLSSIRLKLNNINGPIIYSNNKDIRIWEVTTSGDMESSTCGFYEQYDGSGAGNDNSLTLYSGNYGGTGVYSPVRTIKQDGSISFKKLVSFDEMATFHNLLVPTGYYIYGTNESSGAILSFNEGKTIVGSAGASTKAATHIRSKTGHATIGTGNSATYDILDNGNTFQRNVGINGSYWTYYSPIANSANPFMIYAPVTGGTSGHILVSNGPSNAPVWRAPINVNVGSSNNSDNVKIGGGSTNVYRNVWFNNDATAEYTSGYVFPVCTTKFQYNPGSGDLKLTTVSASGGFFDTSDARLKDFKNDIEIDFDKLKNIPKKYFTWRSDRNNNMNIGTSAQEVQKIYPEIVKENSDGYLSVDYAKLSIVALKAVDELNDKNKKLEKEVSELKEMVMKLIENNK